MSLYGSGGGAGASPRYGIQRTPISSSLAVSVVFNRQPEGKSVLLGPTSNFAGLPNIFSASKAFLHRNSVKIGRVPLSVLDLQRVPLLAREYW